MASCEFIRGCWLVIPEHTSAESQNMSDFDSFTVACGRDFLY